MRTITMAAQKGGAGKTTIALHLAVAAVQDGNRVVVVETDPQRSAAEWWESRTPDAPELVECEGDQIHDVVQAAHDDRVDVVVIDTPPHAKSDAATASRVADLTLIPLRPGVLDVRAVGKTVETIHAIGTRAALLLNACPPKRGPVEPSIVREARRALEAHRIPIFPGVVTDRAAFAHALIDGRAVTEFEPRGKAAREIRELWRWCDAQAR